MHTFEDGFLNVIVCLCLWESINTWPFLLCRWNWCSTPTRVCTAPSCATTPGRERPATSTSAPAPPGHCSAPATRTSRTFSTYPAMIWYSRPHAFYILYLQHISLYSSHQWWWRVSVPLHSVIQFVCVDFHTIVVYEGLRSGAAELYCNGRWILPEAKGWHFIISPVTEEFKLGNCVNCIWSSMHTRHWVKTGTIFCQKQVSSRTLMSSLVSWRLRVIVDTFFKKMQIPL